MNQNRVIALLAAALGLVFGVLLTLTVDITPTEKPAATPDPLILVVQPGQNVQPQQPEIVNDTPFYTPPQDSPGQTLLKAIALMKPGYSGETTRAAQTLTAQLINNGYYYKVTYPDGTERINHVGNKSGYRDDVEFTISPTGYVLNAALSSRSSAHWDVTCPSNSARPTITDLNALLIKTQRAARWWNANLACVYTRY